MITQGGHPHHFASMEMPAFYLEWLLGRLATIPGALTPIAFNIESLVSVVSVGVPVAARDPNSDRVRKAVRPSTGKWVFKRDSPNPFMC
jgi:hypothetical protein